MRAFADRDALVGVIACDAAAVDQLAAGIGGIAIVGDVARAADMDRAVATLVEHWGRLDVLVNNAG